MRSCRYIKTILKSTSTRGPDAFADDLSSIGDHSAVNIANAGGISVSGLELLQQHTDAFPTIYP